MVEQFITVVIVAIVLGLDAFSLAMGMSLKGVTRNHEIKFSILVGLMHIFMPLLGLNLGLTAGKLLGVWAARLGALILVYIAVDLFIKGFKQTRAEPYKFSEAKKMAGGTAVINESGWKTLLILGISVSMDALTVGFSLGTFKMPLTFTVLVMGVVAGTMTMLGFFGGRIFSRIVGIYAQMIGGVILLGLAIRLVL